MGSEGKLVRRRHVFYIEGYDPQGDAGYYRLFGREYARFTKLWSAVGNLSELESDADGIASRWKVETIGANWQVSTTYELLRWEDIVAADLAQPIWRRSLRAIACFAGNIANGTVAHMFRNSRRFGVFYAYPFVILTLAAFVPLCIGLLGGWLTFVHFKSGIAAFASGLALTVASYLVTNTLAHKLRVVHLANAWMWAYDWGRGRRPEFDARLDVFARRIVAGAQSTEVDEIVVAGHSGGATACIPIIARALTNDPGFARRVPHFTVLTLGNPITASHPFARNVRIGLERIVVEPSLLWIECQARKDIMNFYSYDPLRVAEVPAAGTRRNPLLWLMRFDDMLSPAFYRKLRWNFLRMHFQFIMANDRRATYDYFMLVCGPVPVSLWAKRGHEVLSAFSEGGALAADRITVVSEADGTGPDEPWTVRTWSSS